MGSVEPAVPVVLCVDDEPRVLEGLSRTFAFEAEVVTAVGADKAIELLEKGLEPSVIISDMRMPGISGSELLAIVRERWPLVVRVMLTGDADLEVALEAINAGHVFQLLHKPCPPNKLVATLERSVQEHQRLLEEHTHGIQDALTRVGNRRAFDISLKRAHASAVRYATQYSLVLADIDHFKGFNDTLGHVAGDEALQKIAKALQVICRGSDEVFRYGGEEFVVILNETNLEGALAAAERMRNGVEGVGVEHPCNGAGVVTASFGVAVHSKGVSANNVVKEADRCLYQAKEHGRNRVCGPAS